jgi:molybdenum cofactor guanylyltransferase
VAAVAGSTSSSEGGTPAASASASRAELNQGSTAAHPTVAATGALLVGGASTRFGQPKALATLGGRTLAERGWRTLECFAERIAVGKTADGLRLPFAIHDDGTGVRAPIAGVVAALERARHDVCVVLPVDVPLVTPEALGDLARACARADAAVTQTGPLPAAFHRRSLPVLAARLAADDLRLIDAVAVLGTVVVEVDERLVADADTPADLAELERRLRRP